MAISINWATKVISVPKADLTVVQLTPSEIYELDINFFRLTLKDLEDNSDGMTWLTTHNHNPPVSVGGVTLARVIEIINDYTVTFEDGQYAVNLVGANSNIADRVNVNQVSVRAANSAGLVQTKEIEHSSFNDRVTIDVVNGVAGTIYPTGTSVRPVNNIADAIIIAESRGFKTIYTLEDLTIPTGTNLDGYTIQSTNWLVVTVEPGVGLLNTNFEKVSLYGTMGSVWNVLIDCWVYDITNFSGWMRGGSIGEVALSLGTVDSEFGGQSFFDDIVPLFPGNIAIVTMNTDTKVSFTNCTDTAMIKSLTTGSTVDCGLLEGSLIVHSSCTGGTITVGGVGVLTNSSSLTINDEALVNAKKVATKVWDEPLTGATHNVPTSAGRRVRQLGSIVVHDGVAQGPGTNSNQIQLDTGASSVNGAYDPSEIAIILGTGAGQSRMILQYEGATRTATVDRNWKVNPDATSEFIIYVNSGREHVNEGLAQGGTSTTITLNANASPFDDAYNGQIVFLRSGNAQDQVARVTAYNGTTKVATIQTSVGGGWEVIPDTTTAYVMIPYVVTNGVGEGGGLTPTQEAELTRAAKALTLPQFIALQNP